MPNMCQKFEYENDIFVNGYILQTRNERFIVALIYITGDKRDRHVNLLLLQNYYTDEEELDLPVENDDDKNIRFHYVSIKDLSRLSPLRAWWKKINGSWNGLQ